MEPQKEINPFDGVTELMPADIPDEFYGSCNAYAKHAQTWFSQGIAKSGLRAKSGINSTNAIRHMAIIMHSWDPKHEDKIAAVAYLMSQWFDLV